MLHRSYFGDEWRKSDILNRVFSRLKMEIPGIFLIEDERVLGMSSLFLKTEQQASGKLALSNEARLNFLVINTELNSTLIC